MKTEQETSQNLEQTVPDGAADGQNLYFTILILTLATFMSVLDSTVANVSLPKMAGDLSVTPEETIWIISSYIVANAAILPVSGWLASYLGRKRYYLISVWVFTLSSVLCGLSTNLETLIFFRVIQGLGAGGIAPSEQAIIADIAPEEKLGRAFSMYGFGVAAAPILGPTLGGFITDTMSWHWIFFINLPIGIISIILTTLFVHESPKAHEARAAFLKKGAKIDWLGIILFITGIAALELFLEKGPKNSWFESDFVFVTGAVAFFALLIGITWELTREKPAVDILIFKNRGFTGAAIMIFTGSFVISGTTFILPFFTQTLLGYTAMSAGMISLPGTILQMVGIQISGYLSDKFDIRKVIFFGLTASMVTAWSLTSLNLNVDYYTLMEIRAMQLFSLSFLAVTVNTVAYYGLPPDKNNSASAMLNLARNMGASLGVALTSTIITIQTQVHINNLSYHTTTFNPNFTESLRLLTLNLQQQGLNALQAAGVSQGMIWEMVVTQSVMKAILNTVQVYVILYLLLLPLVFLLKGKSKK
jgi:DHA2 family multidrug resistance protein